MPFAVKDVFFTRDLPTCGGSSVFRAAPAANDAPLVAGLVAQGAVLVGKTTMNEFGWGLDEAVGRVLNPRWPTHSAGGSSGGSAATVAAGSVCFAIGTDGGGLDSHAGSLLRRRRSETDSRSERPHGCPPGSKTLVDASPIARTVADLREVVGSRVDVVDDLELGVLEAAGAEPAVAAAYPLPSNASPPGRFPSTSTSTERRKPGTRRSRSRPRRR